MTKFIMLFNNGFSFEFDCVIEASSPQKARAEWKRREDGTWKMSAVLRNSKSLKAVVIK
jgi:hypothetical protein